MIQRPLDLLNEYKGKKVLILLEDFNKNVCSGTLLAFDIHINIAVDNLEVLDAEGNTTKKLGLTFIRGDQIALISPGGK